MKGSVSVAWFVTPSLYLTVLCVHQEQQILEDLDEGAQLSVLLGCPQPHQQLLQPLLQLLFVTHAAPDTLPFSGPPSPVSQPTSDRGLCGSSISDGTGEAERRPSFKHANVQRSSSDRHHMVSHCFGSDADRGVHG